jgi:hypothetical protein
VQEAITNATQIAPERSEGVIVTANDGVDSMRFFVNQLKAQSSMQVGHVKQWLRSIQKRARIQKRHGSRYNEARDDK